MNDFIKKIGYYDGFDHLKKSIATSNVDPLISKAREMLKTVPDLLQNLKLKKPLYDYLLGQSSEGDFYFLNKIETLKNSIQALANTERNPERKKAFLYAANALNKAKSTIIYNMGNAFTELLNSTLQNKEELIAQLKSKLGEYSDSQKSVKQESTTSSPAQSTSSSTQSATEVLTDIVKMPAPKVTPGTII